MAKDFYQTLGVNRTASDKEIRSAYRRLARKLHPDVNPNDKSGEAQFKEINAAYDVLSDKDKRSKYDKYGDNWEHAEEIERMQKQRGGRGGGFAWGGAGGPSISFDEDVDLQNLFGGIFGGGRGRGGRRTAAPPPPRDTEQPIEVTLDEALKGVTRTFVSEGDHGENRRIEVKVPPGVDNGSRVRVAGEGRPSFNGQRGDLYLVVSVKNHPRFERKGDDLYTDVEAPLTVPVLGGEVTVQALDKKVALRLPAGTQNGQTFRLNGLGMPKLGTPDKRGDLFARVRVRLPQTIGDKERRLFEELKEAGL